MNIKFIFKVLDATKKQKELITNWATKAGKDPQKVIEWVESAFKSDAEQVAAAKWIIQGYDPKVFGQALYICQQKKLDPQSQNPEELVESNPELKKKEKPINPDEVLTDKQEDGEGNVTYAARDEDREICRKIIDTHFGVDANPWCLLQAKEGKLTESAYDMWKHYSAYPKRIAFRNGKLLAFSAGERQDYREYWDRSDRSFPFIPYSGKTWQNGWGESFEIKGTEVYKTKGDKRARLRNDYAANVENASEDIAVRHTDSGDLVKVNGYFYPCTTDAQGNYVVNDGDTQFTVSPDLFLEGHFKSDHEEGDYKRGKKDGEWKEFGSLTHKKNADGSGFTAYRPVKSLYNYKNGKLDGAYKNFNLDGDLIIEGTYINGKMEGTWTEYGDDEVVLRQTEYRNDKKDGVQKIFWSSGHVGTESTYKDGKRNGDWIEYYKDSDIPKEVIPYVSGQKQGTAKQYYEDGSLKSQCPYVENYRNGTYESFYRDGKTDRKIQYFDGQMEGEYLAYYKSGELYFKGNYHNDVEDGESLQYYQNGQIKEKSHHKKGELDGEVIDYYPNGNVELRANFKDGLEDGDYYEYDEQGNVTKHVVYKNGEVVE